MNVKTFTAASAALVFGGFCFASGLAQAAESGPPCKAPASVTDIEYPLPRTSALITAGQPVKIIAIGSSSTAGAGASTPAQSYPSRLAVELSDRFPHSKITVINRGINGQESGDILARLKSDVIDERPALVIWQVGTNSVLRDHDTDDVGRHIDDGVAQIKAAGADVVLVDPQFVPRVVAKAEAEGMVKLITQRGRRHRVGVFHRFAVMKYWHDGASMPFESFTSPDGLHLNDWSYGCWAKLMSTSIAQAVSRPTLSAHVVPGTAPRE